MSIEERLVTALRQVDEIVPGDDLWSRVVHSIEEDRLHRRRVVRTAVMISAVVAVLVTAGAVSTTAALGGTHVRRQVMEALEAVGLLTVIALLGPAIRRFGRGFATDLWPTGHPTPSALLRLLDVAYYMVFAGFVLLTTEFEFDDRDFTRPLAGQLREAADRLGGLLLLMGVLHALALVALPLCALVDNATRTDRPLPRWLSIGLTVLALAGTGLAVLVTAALLVGGVR